MLHDDFSQRINRVIRGFAVQRKLSCLKSIAFVCDARQRAERIHSSYLLEIRTLDETLKRTETRGPRLGVMCNSGEPCAARRRGQI
jgi:hypothetical protein